MALDSAANRNSALLAEQGVPLPDGAVGAADRQTLVGDYLPGGAPAPPAAGHCLSSLGCGG